MIATRAWSGRSEGRAELILRNRDRAFACVSREMGLTGHHAPVGVAQPLPEGFDIEATGETVGRPAAPEVMEPRRWVANSAASMAVCLPQRAKFDRR